MSTEVSRRSRSQRWWFALKPASWPKVLVPAIFGQAVGASATGRFHLGAAVVGLIWTMLHVTFVVLVNDWADRDVDGIKRRMFPEGCSPKTIPDGILEARALLVAGVAACVAALLFALGAGVLLDRPLLSPLAALGALTFAAYTLPPLKLNYRGGGELLEMLGIGLVLPIMHDAMQSGVLGTPWLRAMLPAVAVLALASAVASGLSDEVSDRIGGKRTFVTMLGNERARRVIELNVAIGGVSLAGACLVPSGPSPFAVLPAAGVVVAFLARMRARSARAVTNAFAEQGAYKRDLHAAIWLPLLLVAASLVARRALGMEGDAS